MVFEPWQVLGGILLYGIVALAVLGVIIVLIRLIIR